MEKWFDIPERQTFYLFDFEIRHPSMNSFCQTCEIELFGSEIICQNYECFTFR